MSELTLQEKFGLMHQHYRETKKQLAELKREVRKICETFDGHHAVDEWDEHSMPSREWVRELNAFHQKLDPARHRSWRKWSERSKTKRRKP